MKDLAGRHSVIAASVAPGAQARSLAALEAAGVRIRRLEQQIAMRESRIVELELTSAEVAAEFIVLINGLDDPAQRQAQLEALSTLLGVELPR